jgi:fumarate reductase flavoprotein subunit
MLGHLVRQARRSDLVDVLAPARLVDVVMGDDGVEAAVIETPNGQEHVPTRGVLLATNGFGAAKDLVKAHIPEIADAEYYGSEGSTGDALRIGERLGAGTAYLDAYQGHGALAMPAATLAGWATVMHGGFLVDRGGRRFGDETTGYSEFAAIELEKAGGAAWIVVDRRIDEACSVFQDYRDTVASGAVKWGDSVAEVAAAAGVDADGLATTLAQTVAYAGGGEVDPFGRTYWERPLEEPVGLIGVKPALFHTQGGLMVDEHARVLRPDGSALPGLYASGGAAMGISGHGPGGYLAGNGLLPAFGLAYLCADHMATRSD